MSSIVLSGDTSGSVTVSVPAVSGSNTVTIPAVTGTVMVSSNMPAFSYTAAGTQNISGSVVTKVLFATKDFDTANTFTSSKFQPNTAGYYQINSVLGLFVANTGLCLITIYKNGSEYKRGWQGQASIYQLGVSGIVYLNGSTDYVEIYAFTGGASTAATSSYFDGAMVRAA